MTVPLRDRTRERTREKRSQPRAQSQPTRVLRRFVSFGPVEDVPTRPKTRAECIDAPRPCPWAGCRHHLYLDVNPTTGTLKLNFAHLELDEMPQTCSLDMADRGGLTLEEVGEQTNLTRERARQIEMDAIARLRAALGEEP